MLFSTQIERYLGQWITFQKYNKLCKERLNFRNTSHYIAWIMPSALVGGAHIPVAAPVTLLCHTYCEKRQQIRIYEA